MAGTREQIMAALFGKLSTCFAFVAVGRRLRDPENVASNERPALYLIEHEDEYQRPAPNLPPIRTLTCWAIVYTDSRQDQNAIPATQQNNIIDAIDVALAPGGSDDGYQTLGGLVFSCMVDGHVQRASGDVTGKGLIAIPIKIIMP
jgi:hypothetical protein